MDDRRQVHRRQPITTVLDDGREFVAVPLPWMQRNDLGSEVLRQNTEAVNDSVRMYLDPDLNVPQLEARLSDKITDPLAILRLAYPQDPIEKFEGLDFDEVTALVMTSLEVNHLDYLKNLVDPNSPAPTPSGGATSSEEGLTVVGQRIASLVDSSSSDSIESSSSE